MKQTAPLIQSTELRKFAPLDTLGEEDAQELLRTSISIRLSAGTPLFTQDDMDKQVFYLLKGKIELRGTNHSSIIEGGTAAASKPLGRHLPDQVTAKALEESVLISFDADMLELFLNWTNPNAYVVNEMETGQDSEWMNRLLQSRGLLRFSETQINKLMDRMNEIHFDAGQIVVEQGGDDGFYYVIKEGCATVSRKPDSAAKPIKLAELREGDAFGEEALLTASTRGATVTMREEGTLMRLSKQDFSELLANPLLSTISWDEAQAMVATGGVLVDIRLPDDFKEMSIPGSVNIPLQVLRLKLKNLKQNRKYIIYCDDGSRSSVAAFLLNRHGFDAFVLDGGLSSVIPLLGLKKREPEEEQTAQPANSDTAATASEAQVTQTSQGNRYTSLADYWGSTVDEVSNDTFSDSESVYQIEKTRVTPTTGKPAKDKPATVTDIRTAASKSAPSVAKTTPKQPAPAAVANKPHSYRHPLRNALILLAVVMGGGTLYDNPAIMEQAKQLAGFPTTTELQTPAPARTVTAPVMHKESKTTNQAPLPPALVAPPQATAQTENSEPETYLSMDGELLQLQPVINAPSIEAPQKAPVDPATRGFRD